MKQQIKEGNRVFTIDRYRILAGMSQKQLAEQSGMSTAKFAVIEAFTREELDRISEVLNVETDDLLRPRA